MKRYLVICPYFYPFKSPLSKVTQRIIDELAKEDICCDVISLGENKKYTLNEKVNCFFINTFKKNKLMSFFRKSFMKIYSFFYDAQLYYSHLFYRKGKALIKRNHYDGVISISGYFSEHIASFRLNKKFHLAQYFLYADPFFSNGSLRKVSKKKLIQIEKKCLNTCKYAFLLPTFYEEYCKQYPEYQNKFVKYVLPGFFREEELKIINSVKEENNNITYAGSFYYFRKPDNIFSLAKRLQSYTFNLYCGNDIKELGYKNIPNNVIVHERKDGKDFLQAIGKAKYLYLEDNGELSNFIPFKAFEYISTEKKIIFSTDNLNSETSKLISNYQNAYIINQNEDFDDDKFTSFMEEERKVDIIKDELKQFTSAEVIKIILEKICE